MAHIVKGFSIVDKAEVEMQWIFVYWSYVTFLNVFISSMNGNKYVFVCMWFSQDFIHGGVCHMYIIVDIFTFFQYE